MMIALEILGIMLLNIGMVAYTVHTYHLHYYSVALVLIIALILTAFIMYEKIRTRLIKYGKTNATLLSLSSIIGISSMIFLQFFLYNYSFGLGLFTALIAGLEVYLLRDTLGLQ